MSLVKNHQEANETILKFQAEQKIPHDAGGMKVLVTAENTYTKIEWTDCKGTC